MAKRRVGVAVLRLGSFWYLLTLKSLLGSTTEATRSLVNLVSVAVYHPPPSFYFFCSA